MEKDMLAQDNVYQRQEDVVARDIVGEFILVPVSSELRKMHSFFTLNNIGRFIWEQLDGVNDLNAIVEALEDQYDVDRETARNDLNQLIEDLVQARLVTVVSTKKDR